MCVFVSAHVCLHVRQCVYMHVNACLCVEALSVNELRTVIANVQVCACVCVYVRVRVRVRLSVCLFVRAPVCPSAC